MRGQSRQRVDLEHDAVNFVGQLPAQVFDLVVMRDDLFAINFQDLLNAIADPPKLLCWQTEPGEGFEHFGMFLELDTVRCTGRVKHGADRALRDQFRVELFERAGGGVPGVGERFFAFGFEFFIDGLEFLDRHISFATHFEQCGRIFQIQLQRYRADGFEIHRDIVAFCAVAARDAERKFAVAVMNADGHAVHLRFHDVLNPVTSEMFARGGVKRSKFGQRVFVLGAIALVTVGFLGAGRVFGGLHLVERKHRHQMFDPGKFFAGRAADALRGRFGCDQVGKLFLQILQFLEKLVVFAVGDELPAFDVIGVVVPADFVGELGVAGFGFAERHRGNFATRPRPKDSFFVRLWAQPFQAIGPF